MYKLKLLIDGKWTDSVSGKHFQSINPATGTVVAKVAEANAEDVDLAVNSARKALSGPWGRMKPAERGKFLRKIADLIESNAKKLAELDTMDMGRPIQDSFDEIKHSTPDILHFFAGATDNLRGNTIPVGPDKFAYTIREPWGVVGAIIPWNYPLSNAVLKLAPILACGNTLLLKPAEQSPMSAVELGRICLEAEIPDGVVNVLTGDGPTTGAAIARHMGVDMITFTGSTEVGRLIMEMAAKSNLKSVSLELGGKSPNIIFADASLEHALDAATMSVFFNQGQTCTAATRLIVQEEIAEEFIQALVKKAKKIKIGDPMDDSTQLGAVASREQFETIKKYIEIGKKEGAHLATGGSSPKVRALANGFFMLPTVFTGVTMNMRIAQEEIFGPVLSALSFKEEDEAVSIANAVEYGLAASVWTQDISRVHRITQQLDAGLLWINTMFPDYPAVPAGGFKLSGHGKENGMEALNEFTRVKTVWINVNEKRSPWV